MDTLGDVLDGDGSSAPSYETIHIFNVEYTDYNGKLRVHLFGRLQNGEPRHIEVEGHKPSFFVRKSDFTTRIKNHHAVVRAEDGYASIEGDQLVRIYVSLPKQISGNDDLKGLREYFTKTWEADVFYTTRFLIDTGVKTHIRVNRDNGFETEQMRADYRIDVSDLEAIDDPNWRVEPRTITADIEVYSPDGFPEAADAEYPVTSIAAHDNYDDEITVWVLLDDRFHDVSESEVKREIYQNRPDAIELEEHTVTNTVGDVRIFRDESLLLDDFNNYIKARRPDVLAGWNSSGTENGDAFDYPYLLNRCKQLNTYSYDNWSPLGQVWTTRRGREQNLTMGAKGLTFLDGMVTYQKTLFSEPDGGLSLDNISSTELPEDATKLQLSDETPDGVNGADAINWAWKNDVGLFGKYVVRDAQSTVGIDKASGAVELYQDLRRFTGAQFDQCHNVYDTLDQFFFRKAKERGLVLPTNEPVDVDSYYGAYVFDSEPSRHRNVIYFDVAALYPNIIYQLNASPETLIGTEEDLEASEYTKEDCHWSYIDTRTWNVKKDTPPNYERCYFLKPSVRKGFIPDVVDELLEMKQQYKGTDLYMAVKATVNGVYGYAGDASTYSKGSRLYDWRLAESVTLQGRKIIKEAAEWTTEYHSGTYVTNGDTDGFGVAFNSEMEYEDVVRTALDTEEDMTQYLQQYCTDEFAIEESTIDMEAEKLMDPLFIPDDGDGNMVKKKYAYKLRWEQ